MEKLLAMDKHVYDGRDDAYDQHPRQRMLANMGNALLPHNDTSLSAFGFDLSFCHAPRFHTTPEDFFPGI